MLEHLQLRIPIFIWFLEDETYKKAVMTKQNYGSWMGEKVICIKSYSFNCTFLMYACYFYEICNSKIIVGINIWDYSAVKQIQPRMYEVRRHKLPPWLLKLDFLLFGPRVWTMSSLFMMLWLFLLIKVCMHLR